MNLQASFDHALSNYLSLSEELRTDAEMLLEVNEADLINRSDIRRHRNFIRTFVPIIEGYSYCFRQMEEVGLKCEVQGLTTKEQTVIRSPRKFDIKERIKLTLSGSFKMFKLYPRPDFGTEYWKNAKEGLERRNWLTHPKTVADLMIASESWTRIEPGLIWLYKQHCNFIEQFNKKYR